jgi:fructose-1,6-bisphosphatase I
MTSQIDGSDRLSELAGAEGAVGSIFDALGEAIIGLVESLGTYSSESECSEEYFDAACDEVAVKHLLASPHVGWIVSEEQTEPLENPWCTDRAYVVSLDPLDGSENHPVQVTTGMIAGIYGPFSRSTQNITKVLSQPGSQIVAALYAVFGPAVAVGYTLGTGTSLGRLAQTSPLWRSSTKNIQAKHYLRYVSTNWGNRPFWPKWMQVLMDELVELNNPTRQWTSRHVGTLVADFHRNLLRGGVFLYPNDTRSPRGKLRLLYECCPLALLAEQSGLAATDGERRILELTLVHLHERSPLIIGDSEVVRRACELSLSSRGPNEESQ